MESTIKDFIQAYGLEMVATPIASNPNMDNMPKDSRHFSCVITRKDKSMVVPFSVGPGIVENWAVGSKHWRYRGVPPTRGTIMYQEKMDELAPKYRPELADVLDCLASDASTINNARYFEEWAAELGYDEDSRKAEKIYQICQRQAAELEDLVGSRAAYETLLYEIERL